MTVRVHLLPDPGCSYETIAATLARAALSELPSTLTMPSMISGEPEFVAWRSADGDTQADYSFDPVTGLREIDIAGRQALSVSAVLTAAVPLLDAAKLGDFLSDDEPRIQLLGIRGAAAIGAVTLVGEIEALRTGPNRHVTAAAAQAVETLTLRMLALGEQRLAAEQRRAPDRSALFPRLGDANMRRAIVVALLDDPDPDANVAPVLRAALVDSAWQVRAAAVLVTARLGLSDLWPDVRAMEVPGTSRSGLDRAHRDMLLAARKAALDVLAGRPFTASDHPQSALLRDVRAIVEGEMVERLDPRLVWLRDLARGALVNDSPQAGNA